MKIAWIINFYPPYVMGGNELIAKDVILELRNRGHNVYVLTGYGDQFPQDQHHLFPIDLNLDYVVGRLTHPDNFPSPSLKEVIQWYVFNPKTYWATAQTLRTIEPDLVVIDSFALVSPAPLLAALRTRARVVVHVLDQWYIHGLKMPGWGLWICTPRKQLFTATVQRLTQPVFSYLARNTPIIANSHFIKDAYVHAGFAADRLNVAHLGVDVNTFHPKTDRAKLGQPIRLMFAGTLWEGKGAQVAIQSLAQLKKLAPDESFILDIYGKGSPEFQQYLNNTAVDLGVSDTVHFCGFVSQTELARAFHTHDIFLFTSIWQEPFSITLLQAMSSGIPVISTTIGGSPEAIEAYQTGLLVPPDDPVSLARAIRELVQDAGLRCRLSEQASTAVRKKWSFKHYVDTLERLHHAI